MNKYKIVIVSDGLPFNGNSLSTGSLGGSETGVIYLAREFAKAGHAVTVFCPCGPQAEDKIDGVYYFDRAKWKPLGTFMDIDVLIVNRSSAYLADKSKAKAIYFYCQDAMPDSKNVHDRLWQTDRIVLLSPFHRKLWTDIEPLYADHVLEVRNGFDPEILAKAVKSVRKRSAVDDTKINFLYASRPERGLKVLLDMWPEILEKVPNAFLTITYYDTSVLPVHQDVRDLADWCTQIASQFPGSIKVLPKGLKKFDLYRLYLGCKALLYPCGFPEVSCITAIESMATNTLVISTDNYALSDTVSRGHGVLIEGHPGEAKYQEEFILAVEKAATTLEYKERVVSAAHKMTTLYTWEHVARIWLNDFAQLFSGRIKKFPGGVVRSFLHDDDFASAIAINSFLTDAGQTSELQSLAARSLSIDRTDGVGPHIFPGSTGKGQVVRGSIAAYLASRPGKTRILELQTGVGDLAAYLVKQFPQAQVKGLTENLVDLKGAEEFYLHSSDSPLLPEQKARLEFASFDDGPLNDVVIAEKYLDYSLNLEKAVQDLERLLRPGGLCVVITREGPWSGDARAKTPSYLSGRVHNFNGESLEEVLGKKKGFASQCVTHGSNKRGELLSFWVSAWIKSPENPLVGQVDHLRKMAVGRPWKGLSLCMIVRDNEDTISQCIKSVLDVVDEFVIVDTGSNDSTLDIIRRLVPPTRLKIVSFKWIDDFSAARNYALEQCTQDWILWLDSDEFLSGKINMRKYLNSQLFPGFAVHQHHLTMDTELKPDIPIRLFKRGNLKWYGVVHEQIESGMDEGVKPCVLLTDINIVHSGYAVEEMRRDKCFKRNLALMHKDRKVNPDRRLGKMLVCRDYLNLINYRLEKALETREGISEESVLLMREICSCHHDNFLDPKDPIHRKSFLIYQEVLRMMVKLSIPIKKGIVGLGIKSVPFTYKDGEGQTRVRDVHFLTETEYNGYCKSTMETFNPGASD